MSEEFIEEESVEEEFIEIFIRKEKVFNLVNKLMTVFLTVALILVVYVGWQFLRPYKIPTVHIPIAIADRTINKGEPATLLLTTCAYETTKIDVRVQLVTENGTTTPIFTLFDVPQSKGCTKQSPFVIQLERARLPLNPESNPNFLVEDKSFPIQDGKYKIRLKVTYKVNQFREIVKDYDSEQFEYFVEPAAE